MTKIYIQIRDLIIDTEKTIGESLLSTGIFPTFKYVDGLKTEDVIGYTYVVLLASRNFQQLRIKIPGACQIEQRILQDHSPRVHVEGLQLIPYTMNGRSGVAAKAEAIEVIS